MLRYLPWALTAVLVIIAVSLATQNSVLRNLNASLQTERQLAEVTYKMTQNQLSERTLLAERMITDLGNQLRRSNYLSRLEFFTLVPTTDITKEAQGIVVWDPGQQTGFLVMDKLPATSDARDYQVWITDPAYKDPVNAGAFHVATAGKVTFAFQPGRSITQARAFVISLERKGGGTKAEGPVVLRTK